MEEMNGGIKIYIVGVSYHGTMHLPIYIVVLVVGHPFYRDWFLRSWF